MAMGAWDMRFSERGLYLSGVCKMSGFEQTEMEERKLEKREHIRRSKFCIVCVSLAFGVLYSSLFLVGLFGDYDVYDEMTAAFLSLSCIGFP